MSCWLVLMFSAASLAAETKPPNIVFCIADDWGWPHASVYGDKVVKTPTFNRIAEQGVLFEHAFVASPSCTPSRNAALTGQYHWRLGPGANLWSQFPEGIDTYPRMLEQAGYYVGSYRKAFGPGRDLPSPVAGDKVRSVDEFFKKRPAGQAFCFWFGSSDPHRSYKKGSGVASGMKLEEVQVPPYYPDTETVRSDICDYYFEVQRFDREVGELLEKLEAMGELSNTLVVMTGDHGWPFPRGKSNLYDAGTRVPLAMMWGDQLKHGRTIKDFVSFVDLAPTFLDLAGLKRPDSMSGHSLLPLLKSEQQGWLDSSRGSVIFGKERHTPCQETGQLAAACRAIRTVDFLYIHNFFPDRWPAGAPKAEHRSNWGDCDDGPTKNEILKHRNDPQGKQFYQLSFGKRPQDELYQLSTDPHQMHNLAENPEYAETLVRLKTQLMQELTASGDLRMQGKGHIYESYGYKQYGNR
ncbi:sulfatase [Verrucomicrobiaceae bacterium 5K15]|uniref:Sulfatase n=1 Tax=Oceaniferula flava TaxID=2800421 RepID=A0AAE2SD66_9BACT|nr:sulfatase [Oceaniferula flavus]MBK1854807.1 sulfatase [Oceaniferula flavus]MBM1136113.1 sulfatase [Oceaniferula flavus]